MIEAFIKDRQINNELSPATAIPPGIMPWNIILNIIVEKNTVI